MRFDLPQLLPLVCLACRTRSERGHEVFTLELEKTLRADAGEVVEGILGCVSCGRRYPIIDGIPVVVADLGAFLGRELLGLVDPDLDPDVAALLALPGPDDAAMPRLLETLSIYLDAHWGDHAAPRPDGPGARVDDAVLAKLRGRPRVAAAIELGCSVGRGLAELARGAELTLGVDLNLAYLRRARRILDGRGHAYARRVVGRHYVSARIAAPRTHGVELLCADAQDPPLVPGRFDRVAALNVLDAVHDPGAVLAVATGLVRARGELHVASPYAWQSGFVADERRIGGADPAAEVARRVIEAGFTVEEQVDLDWCLRRDARSAAAYSVHYLRARKINSY